MHIPRTSVAICLGIASLPAVTAFYSYIPVYADDDVPPPPHKRAPFYAYSPHYEDEDSSSTATTTAANAPRRAPTLPIRRVRTGQYRRDNIYDITDNKDPGQKNSVAINQDGTDFTYMVAVKIGSSDKEYHFVLDSASSSTWVMADDCEAEPCSLHTTFGPDDSDSLKVDGTPWSVTYGSGTASGITATDTLRIAGLSPTLSINLATNVSTEFRTQPFDGLLGLGRDETLTSDSSPQLLTVLAASKLIPAKLYGIHFSRHADGVHDGELNLGAPNPARYDGELNYIPCVAETAGFWEVALDDAGVGASLVNFGPRTAIMDTGTSFIMMPLADASALHDLVRGSTNSGETFEVPCDTAAEIQFVLGGTTYGISTKDWVGGPLANGMCKSNVIGRQAFTADTQWLVGDVFLKNVYAVYDYEENRMGFGTKGGKGVEGEQVQSSVAAPSGTATAGVPQGTGNATSPTPGAPTPTTPSSNPSGSAPPEGGAATLSSSVALAVAVGLVVALFV